MAGGDDFILAGVFRILLGTRILLRAARIALGCYFFLIQERSNQESELGRSLQDLPASRRFTTNGGAFAVSKFLHLRGIYPTPQMGLLLAKTFTVLFRLKFVQTHGALQLAKALAFACCVCLPCSHFFIKTRARTQCRVSVRRRRQQKILPTPCIFSS
jgi:hypothetical protein